MALTDCPKCWSTPCECGYEYEGYSVEALMKMRDLFQRLIDRKTAAQVHVDVGVPSEEE